MYPPLEPLLTAFAAGGALWVGLTAATRAR
jgi:hypothetical protein